MRVITKDEEIILWDKLNNEFKFRPGTDISGEWIIMPGDTKKYHKAIPWNKEQKKIISSILKEIGLEKMYALEFIKNKTKWGSQVQGSFRKLSEHDYNVIANEIRKRIENE